MSQASNTSQFDTLDSQLSSHETCSPSLIESSSKSVKNKTFKAIDNRNSSKKATLNTSDEMIDDQDLNEQHSKKKTSGKSTNDKPSPTRKASSSKSSSSKMSTSKTLPSKSSSSGKRKVDEAFSDKPKDSTEEEVVQHIQVDVDFTEEEMKIIRAKELDVPLEKLRALGDVVVDSVNKDDVFEKNVLPKFRTKEEPVTRPKKVQKKAANDPTQEKYKKLLKAHSLKEDEEGLEVGMKVSIILNGVLIGHGELVEDESGNFQVGDSVNVEISALIRDDEDFDLSSTYLIEKTKLVRKCWIELYSDEFLKLLNNNTQPKQSKTGKSPIDQQKDVGKSSNGKPSASNLQEEVLRLKQSNKDKKKQIETLQKEISKLKQELVKAKEESVQSKKAIYAITNVLNKYHAEQKKASSSITFDIYWKVEKDGKTKRVKKTIPITAQEHNLLLSKKKKH